MTPAEYDKRQFMVQYVLARAALLHDLDPERCAMTANKVWKIIEQNTQSPAPK